MKIKIALLITALLTLNSCAVWDAYNLRSFDNNEYLIVTQIATRGELAVEACGDISTTIDNITAIQYDAALLSKYSSGFANNEKASAASQKLNKIVGITVPMLQTSNYSVKFCERQMALIGALASKLQSAIGTKSQ